jgi:hypothetical protein
MNNHFAELGDVWKHLPLAEILRINPPPDRVAPGSGAETSNPDQGSYSVNCLIFLRKHKLDAGRFKNFAAPSVRSDFN